MIIPFPFYTKLLVQNLDFLGIPTAIVISMFLGLILHYVLLRLSPEARLAMSRPTKDCFRDLGEYLKIGLSTLGLLIVDAWGFSCMTFVSGYLSKE